MEMETRSVILFGSTVFFVLSPSIVFAQTTGLPTGCHVATQAEIVAGAVPGTQVCPADQAAGINADVSGAKEYLLSIAHNLRNSQAPPDAAHIKPLNPTFAICAANFLKAYADRYGPVAVVSACRSCPGGDPTENARAGGAPDSNHQKGLAMDINPNGAASSYQTLWTFASNNPSFGVCFPHQDGHQSTHYYDLPHMILAGIRGSEGASCAAQGVIKPCSGSGVPPLLIAPASPSSPAPQITPRTPTQQILSTACSFLGGTNCYQQDIIQQCPQGFYPQRYLYSSDPMDVRVTCVAASQNGQCPPGSYFVNGQCTAASQVNPQQFPQQPQYAQQQQSQPQSSNGTPTSNAQQPISSILNSTPPPSNNSLVPISSFLSQQGSNLTLNTPHATSGTSTLDLLMWYAGIGTSPTPTPTTNQSPAQLNPNITSGTTIGLHPSPTYANVGATVPTSSTIGNITPINNETTFTSSDLGNSPDSSYSMVGQSTFQTILANIKATLIQILAYLRPFGGTVPSQFEGD